MHKEHKEFASLKFESCNDPVERGAYIMPAGLRIIVLDKSIRVGYEHFYLERVPQAKDLLTMDYVYEMGRGDAQAKMRTALGLTE